MRKKEEVTQFMWKGYYTKLHEYHGINADKKVFEEQRSSTGKNKQAEHCIVGPTE